jgi:hypothetical protein
LAPGPEVKNAQALTDSLLDGYFSTPNRVAPAV